MDSHLKKNLLEAIEFQKANKTVFVAMLGLLAYTQLYPSLIDKLLTEKIAPYLKITHSPAADIIFGIFYFVALVSIIIKIGISFYEFRPSLKDLFYPAVIIIVYLLHRFNLLKGSGWVFEPFQSFPLLRYADSVVLLLLAVLYHPREYLLPAAIDPALPQLMEDDLMNKNGGVDILKRNSYANYIAKLVMNIKTVNTFAIGIKGSWGSGKSVFIRQIENQLSNAIVIRFNPWLSKKEDEVLVDFFKVLIERTGMYNNDLSRKLERYYSNLANIDENFGKKILSTFNLIKSKNEVSLEEQQKSIARIIRDNRLKLVVFIDDLDRLSAMEVLSVFKLIRNSLNFPNTVFLIAYDEKYVTAILESHIENPEKFIEKIFQLEIDLPSVPSIIIEQQLESLLTNEKTTDQIDKIKNGLRIVKDNKILEEAIKNIRDAIRFSNAVNHLFWKKEKEVDVVDFMLLELLKLKSRKVFHEIRSALIAGTNLAYLKSPDGSFAENNPLAFNDVEQPGKMNALEKNLLSTLFNRTSSFDEVKSVRFVGNAIRYFSDDLFGNISYKDFDQFKESTFEGFKSVIDRAIANSNIEELTNKMLRINTFPDSQSFFNINKGFLYVSFKLGRYTYTEIVHNNIKNNFDNLRSGLSDDAAFDKYLHDLLTNHETDALEESQVLGIMLNVIVTNIDSQKVDYPKGKIIDLLLNNLKQFIDKHDASFDSLVFDIYYALSDKIENERNIILPAANEILKEYVINHADSYFKEWLIRPKFAGTINPEIFVLEPYINQYMGYDEFEKMLYSLNAGIEVLKLQGFYEKFKASGYTEAKYNKNIIELYSNRHTMFVESPQFAAFKPSLSQEETKKMKFSAAFPILQNARWITRTSVITEEEALSGGVYVFERILELSALNENIKSAKLFCLVDDYLQISINKKMILGELNGFEKLHTVDLGDDLKNENTVIRFFVRNATSTITELQGDPNNNPFEFIYALIIELDNQLE